MGENWTISIPTGEGVEIYDARLGDPCAQELADRITSLEAELESIRDRAWQEGHDAGFAEGLKLRDEAVNNHDNHARDFLKEVEESIPAFMDQMVPRLMALTGEIAGHFVMSMPVDVRQLEREIREALSRFSSGGRLEILLNSADISALGELGLDFKSLQSSGSELTVQASDRVTPGGFLIHTRMGSVDYTRETRLKKILSALEVDG